MRNYTIVKVIAWSMLCIVLIAACLSLVSCKKTEQGDCYTCYVRKNKSKNVASSYVRKIIDTVYKCNETAESIFLYKGANTIDYAKEDDSVISVTVYCEKTQQ